MPEYPRLQSLKGINRVMARYYVQRRVLARFRPLAYVTSGAPVEIMEAMGILTLYPENYGALCGARKAAVGLCQVADIGARGQYPVTGFSLGGDIDFRPAQRLWRRRRR